MNTKSLYDRDFIVWIETHKRLLLERRFNELDVANLIDELDGVAAQVRKQIRSLIRESIYQAYLFQFLPNHLPITEIVHTSGRVIMELEELFDQNPSLEDSRWLWDLVKKEQKRARPIMKEKLLEYGVELSDVEIATVTIKRFLPSRTAERLAKFNRQE